MGTMTKKDGMWQLDIPVSTTGSVSQTLGTSGTYVDANIKVNVNPVAGKAQVADTTITANPTIASTPTSSKYAISVSKTQTVTPVTETNGVIDNTTAHTGGTVTITGSATIDESTIADPTTTVPATIDKTVSPDVEDRYIKISEGYDPDDRYIKISGMSGSAGEYTVDAGADVVKKPVIANLAEQEISGKEQLDANITTAQSSVTAPYYMAIQSPANTATLTATAEVTAAGYLATGSKTDTALAGADASDITYINIAASAENTTITDTDTTVTVGAKSGDVYPLTNTLSSQLHTTSAGWSPVEDKAEESHSNVKVGTIAASTVSSTGTVTSTPTVDISTTPTNIVTSATDTGYSFTVAATNTAGSVTPKHSATAGYTPAIADVAGTAVSVAPTNSGTGTTFIQAAVLKGEVTNNTAGSASMTATSVESAASGDHYITLNTTAGSVKAKASATTEGYVDDQTDVSAAATVNVTGNDTVFYIKDAVTTQGTTTVSWKTNKAGTYMTEPGGTTSAGSYASGDSITITEVKEGLDDIALWGKVADAKWIILDDVNDTVVRGTESITEGYIEDQTLAAATFNNAATTGKTYVDLSATDAAPVLTTNGFLYIDKGYTDYVKISLSKLVPEGASAGIAAGDILSGHSAYNSNGELITGTIANLLSTDVTAAVSGTNYVITIPAEKYTTGSEITKTACAVYQGSYS